MIRTDVFVRGIPWVGLLLRHRSAAVGLNLGWRHRSSALAAVALVFDRVLSTARGGHRSRRPDRLERLVYGLLLRRRGPLQTAIGFVLPSCITYSPWPRSRSASRHAVRRGSGDDAGARGRVAEPVRIHRLTTGRVRGPRRPRGARRYVIRSWSDETLPVNAFLIEHPAGSASSTRDSRPPRRSPASAGRHPFIRMARFELADEMAAPQLRKLGFESGSVRWAGAAGTFAPTTWEELGTSPGPDIVGSLSIRVELTPRDFAVTSSATL